jgi:hypothetical protein
MKERDDKRSKLHEVEKEITLVRFLQKLFEHFSRLSDINQMNFMHLQLFYLIRIRQLILKINISL